MVAQFKPVILEDYAVLEGGLLWFYGYKQVERKYNIL